MKLELCMEGDQLNEPERLPVTLTLKPSKVCGCQCQGSFWAYIVGQDNSDSKSNRLHVDILRFCSHSFEVYSIYSS